MLAVQLFYLQYFAFESHPCGTDHCFGYQNQ